MKIFVTQLFRRPRNSAPRASQYGINAEERVLDRGRGGAERARGADALLTLLTDKIDAEVFEAGPQLKIVADKIGYDNVDVRDATRRGVMVTNTPGVLTDATAVHTRGHCFLQSRAASPNRKNICARENSRAGDRCFFLVAPSPEARWVLSARVASGPP